MTPEHPDDVCACGHCRDQHRGLALMPGAVPHCLIRGCECPGFRKLRKGAISDLGRLLQEAGARVTFDPERSIAKPCFVCGTTERPRDLVKVGTWTRRIGGHTPGDPITRPMCAACETETR